MLIGCERCTGCGACAVVCPNNCIEMTLDYEGFRQPKIDVDKCVQCLRCEDACPVMQKPSVHDLPAVFAAKNRKESIREESSSGGVFTALAECVLQQGGVVCAAMYDADFYVIHNFVHAACDLEQFRGAKYAQSRAEHCFPEIKKMLREGMIVLFVGTPCQVAGLSSYLGKVSSNLILVDMICHGVPSPTVWQKYLKERMRADGCASIQKINLRSKKSGWSRFKYSVEINYCDGSRYLVPQGEDWFIRGFVENLYLRRSCENCNFKGVQRSSDITLGDFWGIWDLNPEFDDNQGTSLVWVHSPTGNTLWQEIRQQLDVQQLSVDDSISMNPSALHNAEPHLKRSEFFAEVDKSEVIPRIQQILSESKPRVSLLKRIINRFK